MSVTGWLQILSFTLCKTTQFLPFQKQLCLMQAVLLHAALNANELCLPHIIRKGYMQRFIKKNLHSLFLGVKLAVIF